MLNGFNSQPMILALRTCRLAILPLVLALTGCAVQGSAYQRAATPPARSVVYIYRPYNLMGSGFVPAINCGDYSTSLGPGGFHKFTIDPGTFHCDVHTEVTTQAEIDAKPGQEYYIRESIWPRWILAHVHLDVPDPDQAQAEIQQCKAQ